MKASFDADGDVLVVTGGSGGIGGALAHAYAEAGGAAVVFDAHAPGQAHAGVTHLPVDVRDRDAVFAATEEVLDRYGRVDALVAAAAVQPRVDLVETAPEVWTDAIDTNLSGVVWACQAVLPHMIARRSGAIVVFSSGLARFGRAQATAYASSKGALEPFAKSLAAEVAPYDIRVNVVFPGVIDTEQFQRANPTGGEREHWLGATGIGAPADVVGPLLFLLSDAGTMTGSVLSRDRAFPYERYGDRG